MNISMMAALIMLGALTHACAADGKIAIVAAENFYGGVAQQIGGDSVSVTSILKNRDQDPHLFETSPSVVRDVAAAQVVIQNGANYDSWMEGLLKVTPKPGRVLIMVADLLHKNAGDNPHLWYDPATMPAVAKAVAQALKAADPAQADNYEARLKSFLASLQPLDDKITSIRSRYGGLPVTATEPVFGYMAASLGLTMLDQKFQLAVMNDTQPSASDVAAFEQDLKMHKVRVLFYNKQVSDNMVQRLVGIAHQSDVPVVGVTETAPAGLSYQDWMLTQLEATEKALAGNR
ncbi:metal ABC transporter solute-binding protein, Zn/Mn family [Bradyrhizobium sp. WSM3983]|uniref:metal ABC transporter solute-binding protein, Zn/Mn family n=1 Tax=Bradyrhizobium sp. WSM3983 TaxID=1038867 RepID=UPI0004236D8A|nr:zinc ABC transporter substrate-binding protein [Bradyrhizobium sp. WSM3983]